MDYRFSHHCGENVDLSKEKFKASWTHRFSDGVAFSCQPIQNYTRLKLDLAGTGHAYVGTISRDPETIKCMRNTLSHDVNVLKEMKVHKRLCAVDIKTLNKDGRQHVSFNFPGEEKHKEADEDIWLFLYIKFGDLVAVIRKFKMLMKYNVIICSFLAKVSEFVLYFSTTNAYPDLRNTLWTRYCNSNVKK